LQLSWLYPDSPGQKQSLRPGAVSITFAYPFAPHDSKAITFKTKGAESLG